MQPFDAPSQLVKFALALAISITFMAVATSVQVDEVAYGEVMAEVTPRGTSPLPPTGPTSTPPPAATPSPTPSTSDASTPSISIPPGTPTPASPIAAALPTSTASVSQSPPPSAVKQDSVPSGFERPAPLKTRETLEAKPGASAQINVGGGSVTASSQTGVEGGPVTVAAAALSQAQKEAAANKGLLLTNIAFTLSPEMSLSKAPDVSVTYTASQIAGIDPDSLSLYEYHADASRWERVKGCVLRGEEKTISCQGLGQGYYVVAGERPVKSAAQLSGKSGQGGRASLIIIAGLGILGALGLMGAIAVLRKRGQGGP